MRVVGADSGGEGGDSALRGDVSGHQEADDGRGAGHRGANRHTDRHLRRAASQACDARGTQDGTVDQVRPATRHRGRDAVRHTRDSDQHTQTDRQTEERTATALRPTR